MGRIHSAAVAAAFLASLGLFTGCSSLYNEEPPIPFEISRVVLPKDIPPPSDERNGYVSTSNSGDAKPGSSGDLSARKAAAEAQEKMHARSASAAGEPNPAELVKVKVPASGEGSFLTSKSFVTRWNVLGPISAGAGESLADALQTEYVQGEKTVDGTRNAPDGASWNVRLFGGTNPPGIVDIGDLFQGDSSACAYYATACLDSPDDVEGVSLLLSSSMPVKVWLNGVLVHTYDKGPREIKLDQDVIESLYLKRGYNRLVVKCVAPKGMPQRKFMLRFATTDGAPISTEP